MISPYKYRLINLYKPILSIPVQTKILFPVSRNKTMHNYPHRMSRDTVTPYRLAFTRLAALQWVAGEVPANCTLRFGAGRHQITLVQSESVLRGQLMHGSMQYIETMDEAVDDSNS
jgi:hypothetical protein